MLCHLCPFRLGKPSPAAVSTSDYDAVRTLLEVLAGRVDFPCRDALAPPLPAEPCEGAFILAAHLVERKWFSIKEHAELAGIILEMMDHVQDRSVPLGVRAGTLPVLKAAFTELILWTLQFRIDPDLMGAPYPPAPAAPASNISH